MKKILKALLRILISFGLLAVLILINYRHLEHVPELLKNLNILFLFLSIIFYFLSIIFEAPRWRSLLKAHNIHIPLAYLLNSVLIGGFYNTLLPTSVGGDAYRGIDLHKKFKVSIHENILSLLLGRFLGIISGIVFLLVSFSFKMYQHLSRPFTLGLIIFFPVIIFLVILLVIPKKFKLDVLFGKIKFLRRFKKSVFEFSEVLDSYKRKGKYVFISFLYSVLSNLLSFTSFYFIGLALKINLGFIPYMFIIPVTWAISNIPITLGGFGLRENTLVILLKEFGVRSSSALTFSLIVLVFNILMAIIGGIMLIIRNFIFKNKKL
ncbi:MAG: lysylphosphatidylglycerol synthase transmembrane domain-containing protein [Actinomycetota bacterium]|nr:lysylphosphatidylglycerol synthase transmembrane domain-containing protein [Actinomycetota bacterium]